MSNWQPISTAPKFDFSSILGSDGDEVRVTHFDPHEDAWIADMPYTHPVRVWTPTYWQPLPEPPK